MNENDPVILGYATPKGANGFARLPQSVIILVAMLVPGLSSSLIRGSAWRCVILVTTVLAAFLVFGPLWGEVLFPSPPLTNLGLYPFVVTCGVVEIVSVVQAMRDRAKALLERIS